MIPGERLLQVLAEQRASQPPLRVSAELQGLGPDWPQHVQIELHPQGGYRVSDAQGGRWVVRGGALVGGTTQQPPPWLPDLELLILRLEEELGAWMARAGVDLARNELARCEKADCYVLGGRDAPSQVWLDKDRLEVVRWVAGRQRELRFRDYTSWGELRFPSRIEIRRDDAPYATFTVLDAAPAPALLPADFSPAWADDGSVTPRD